MIAHEFKDPIEVSTPKGDGFIWYMMDYGPQSDTLYTIILKETGECWQMCHKDFRVKQNTTFSIRGKYGAPNGSNGKPELNGSTKINGVQNLNGVLK